MPDSYISQPTNKIHLHLAMKKYPIDHLKVKTPLILSKVFRNMSKTRALLLKLSCSSIAGVFI